MKLWIGLVVFFAAGMAQAGQSAGGNDRQVESINIRSSWGGLSPDSPLITELELNCDGIPTGDDFMDRMNQKKDLCIGKVYSAEGKELP